MTELLREPPGPCCVLPCNRFYEEYQANGCVSWDNYQRDPIANQKKVIELYNSDFFYGTIRITTPAAVKLMENIIFNPNNGDGSNNNFDPRLSRNRHLYTGHAYRLGFFAGITVEADRVVVDLNQKKIEVSKRFSLLQKFYSHVELADQPFPPGDGPTNFGDELKSARFSCVQNGVLGFSSHHGIHGNNNFMLRLSNLVIRGFEVAAIALNAAKNIDIRNVDIQGTTTDVPVLGIYSSAVQMRFFFQMAIANATLEEARQDLVAKRNALANSVELVTEDVRRKGCVDPDRKLTKIYINDTGFADGTAAYGIVIHGAGPAVGAFSPAPPAEWASDDISIEDVTVDGIINQPREVVALSRGNQPAPAVSYNGDVQTDTAGAVFQIIKVLGRDGLYKPNVVSEAQIALARWSDPYLDGADPALVALREQGMFGTLSIHPAVVSWARTDVIYRKITTETKFSQVMKVGEISYLCNGYSMFHVMKGTMGIRIDSVLNTYIRGQISNIRNRGKRGSDICGKYDGPKNGGHPNQKRMIGYTGADAYGIIVSASETVRLEDLSVDEVHSFNGTAQGLHFDGYTKDVAMTDVEIDTIQTNAPIFPFLPNKIAPAYGIFVDKTTRIFRVARTKINNVTSLSADYLSHKWFLDKNISVLE